MSLGYLIFPIPFWKALDICLTLDFILTGFNSLIVGRLMVDDWPWLHFLAYTAASGWRVVLIYPWVRRAGLASIYITLSFFLLLPCSVSLRDSQPAASLWPPSLCWPTFAVTSTNNGPATTDQVWTCSVHQKNTPKQFMQITASAQFQ